MTASPEFRAWWHGIAALPADRTDRMYFTLRRVWGDHTLTGGSRFYRWSSESHITAALFQNWALFPDLTWVAPLVRACGGQAGNVTQASWAYACEELLDIKLLLCFRSRYIIPDVMLYFIDENGPGLLALEVKKPNVVAKPKDARKLWGYCDLPSTRRIGRRYGCFLVGEGQVAATLEAAEQEWHAISWERLRELQVQIAEEMAIPEAHRQRVVAWLSHAYARYGIGSSSSSAPKPLADVEYEELRRLGLPASVERFLRGSECVEAAASGLDPATPYAWLSCEPSAEDIRRRKPQSTAERRIIRWGPQWSIEQEPV
jgi:hypothetical protein